MNKERNDLKIFFYLGTIILLVVIVFLPPGLSDFILSPQGGGMVHCDPQMSDNIRLPVPTPNATINVGEVWYRHDLGGEKIGTWGNGIAGNGKIAACTFGPGVFVTSIDNLILYDYYGKHLWSSGWWLFPNITQYNWSLNPSACGSVPMIDINDQVVACDNQRVILVNASDHNNIHVEWISYLPEKLVVKGELPISPTIVESKTIIIPTKNGPLYAFNVSNGQVLANLTFSDNSSSDPLYGIREMNWSNFISIMSNPLACPYHYNSSSHKVEWNSTVPYGIMPMTPVFLEGTILFMTDNNGTVAAIETTNGSILAINSIETPELITDEKIYSTQNSACVQGNRTYILTGYSAPGWRITNKQYGRLYAVDVNPDAQNLSDRLRIAWHYSYPGQSQATPTLINNTIFFDGYNGTTMCKTPPPNRDPQIYAVYTNGTLRWKTAAHNITEFSFSMDPRGGFWYEDSGLKMNGGGGKKLVHYYENGTVKEVIDMTDLMYNINHSSPIYPCSCMTICGTATHPIMIVSANHRLGEPGKWVVAINLNNNNSLL